MRILPYFSYLTMWNKHFFIFLSYVTCECHPFHSPASQICILCHSPHTFVNVFLLVRLPVANHCLWWIIHSGHWGMKLFDWQLYFTISYIIKIPLLGIVTIRRASEGQRGVIGSLERPSLLQTHIAFFVHPSIFSSTSHPSFCISWAFHFVSCNTLFSCFVLR